MGVTIDIDDVDFDFGDQAEESPVPNLKPHSTAGTSIIFDIETGPRPWAEIEKFYTPPEKLPPFDPAAVKCGNLGAEKAKEKIAKAAADHAAAVANEAAAAEQHKAEWLSKAALSPITGRVLAIGMQACVDIKTAETPNILEYGGEGMLLAYFWAAFDRIVADGGQLVGFNCQFFDLPFLVRRSWLLDVDVPDGVMKGRYFSSVFVDLMVLWGCGGNGMVSLDMLAKYFGIGGKPDGIDGGMFAAMYENPETREQALAYLRNDLEMTAGVARKMGVC